MKRIIVLVFTIYIITSFLLSQNSNIYCNTSTNDNINFIIVNREQDFIEIEIDFSKLPYQIIYNEKNEAIIVMPNLGKNTNSGEPELPKTIFRVGMLPNVKRESIKLKILQQDITNLGTSYNITPVETPRPVLNGWDDQNEEYKPERDLSIYNSNNLFPYSPIIISPLSNIKDWIFVSLELWPFQYNPQKSSLKRIDFIKCRVDFELDKTNIQQYNTDDFLQEKFHEPWKGSIKKSSPRDENGYVIITTNDIVSISENIDDFIGCKENCGYSVQVVTEDDYGIIVGQPPNGTAEKIRQWLIDNYLSLNIQYVLLIGDPDPDDPYNPDDHIGDIPMKMLYPRVGNAYTGYSSPSDYFYADLTGNWNLDGDELFGEHRSNSEPVTPDPQIEENTFSIRWIGKINVTDPVGIRICPIFDDGIRIWIDDLSGDPVINEWSDHLGGGGMGYNIFTPGLHDIKIEYYQNMSNSFFRLRKKSLGGGGYYYMRGSELYYWDGTSYQQGGLNGEYYNHMDLTDYIFSRIDPNNPSDCFNFNWFSGDRGDGGVDFSPEISIGRIPVYDNDYSQLDEIFDKLITYQYSSATSWRNNVLLPMKPFDVVTPNYQLAEQIRTELCEPNDFDYYRIYDEDYGCTPLPEATPCTEVNVLTAWQNSFGLVTWATHGSSLSAIDVLTNSSCSQLDDDKPAFVFQGSCNNGWPEDSNNLGYTLLKNGAVATVSSTRTSWYISGNSYVLPGNLKIHGFCFFFSQYLIENNSGGESLNLVKNFEANSLHDYEWMNIFDFNLYGDPAITLTSSPCEDSIPPSISILLFPVNGSTINVNPNFIWHSSIDTLSGVDYYILEYADNQNFINTTSLNIIDTTYTPDYTLFDTTYYWKVKAVDIVGNNSDFSQVWNFTVVKPLIADFEANPTEGLLPLEVQFADLSTPKDSIVSWQWDWGDGSDTTYTTFIDTFVHIYENPDTLTVSLTITHINNSIDNETKVNYINVLPLGIPENISIIVEEDSIHITWNQVACAISYNIYSSDNPYTGFGLEHFGITGTTWSESLSLLGDKKFFYVVAEFLGGKSNYNSR